MTSFRGRERAVKLLTQAVERNGLSLYSKPEKKMWNGGIDRDKFIELLVGVNVHSMRI